MAMSDDVAHTLRCPACHGTITWQDDAVKCDSCAKSYPVSRGVPVLIDATRSIFDPDEIAAASGMTWTARPGLRRFIPQPSLNVGAAASFQALATHLVELSPNPLVLVVGGGEGGFGENVLRNSGVTTVRSDVVIAGATDVGADGHDLPFADGSFDGVVVQAVMEHVLDPWRCAEEIHRVLRPGGIVYAETPFMQQVHMGAWDFTRFSALGHRRLFRRFEQIDAGIAVGAGSALAWSLCYFMTSFARSPRGRKLLFAGSRFLFSWLKFFDRVLTSDIAFDAASAFYFLGRRSEQVLSDRDLIESYRGGIRRGASGT